MNDKLLAKIKNVENQMITYADFMSIALYDREIGYYMKENKKIGREGDFYTSSSVHAIFGKVFAHFFLDVMDKEQLPRRVIEFGGGDGRFAHAVLTEWQKIAPVGLNLSYTIIEMSPFHRNEQRKLLSEIDGFLQYEDLAAYKKEHGEKFDGVIFSNELLDSFPVHVIERNQENVEEVFVCLDEDDRLIEKKQLCSNQEILNWLTSYGPKLVEGQRIEVPLLMEKWLEEVAQLLHKGMLVTIDYGYTKADWEMALRKRGSLRGYYKHKLIDNPLENPTEMDLTTHIHLDAYNEIAAQIGLVKVASERQDKFLIKLGMLKFLQENYDPNPFTEKSKQNRAIRTLISDSGMSAAFHVFVHSKNLKHTDTYNFLHDDPYDI